MLAYIRWMMLNLNQFIDLFTEHSSIAHNKNMATGNKLHKVEYHWKFRWEQVSLGEANWADIKNKILAIQLWICPRENLIPEQEKSEKRGISMEFYSWNENEDFFNQFVQCSNFIQCPLISLRKIVALVNRKSEIYSASGPLAKRLLEFN